MLIITYRKGQFNMSLSTIEMISNLRVGQYAKCLECQELSYGVKIEDGSFYWVDSKRIKSDFFSLTNDALSYRWEIINEYIQFSKAIDAFLNGKTIISYDEDGEECCEYNIERDEEKCIPITEILYNYWAIGTE